MTDKKADIYTPVGRLEARPFDNSDVVAETTLGTKGPIELWIQFDNLSVGAKGGEKVTVNLAKVLKGLEKLGGLND